MKVIIAGSRNFSPAQATDLVQRAIKASGFTITEVVSGTAKGIDQAGERWAGKSNISVKRFKPNWIRHGDAAGHFRNTQMAEYAEALIAIRPQTHCTPGTQSMIRIAKAAGLTVFIYETSSNPKGN